MAYSAPMTPFLRILSSRAIAVSVLCAAVATSAVAQSPRAEKPARPAPADLVLRGGPVYTMDAARSWARAVAVANGRIVFVGSEAAASAWVGPRTRVVDLAGRMLLPGFQDAHIHPISGGIELGQCNLNDTPTAEGLLEKVKACARERPTGWIVGGGWALPTFPGGAPTRGALDAVVADRPVYLSASDGHSAWVNSKALEMANITADTPDPANGRIEREAGTQNPSGTLRESATGLVERLLPQPTPAERLAGLQRALELANRHGLVALQEANAGSGPEGGGRSALETYREAERQGRLTARVTVALGTEVAKGPEQVDELVRLRREFTSARVRPTAAKIFEDGVIEARTAAMLEPYLDRPGVRGEPRFPPERLNPLVARLVRDDFTVHVHAIGDRAVRLALDAVEAAGGGAGTRALRHQIAHLEVVHPDDVPRFRKLGVIANFQPLWAYADTWITDLTIPALGPERSRWIYPIGSLARAGAVLAFGSDWSVSSLDPLEGIQVAVTRQGPAGEAAPPLDPEEAIPLPAALAAYTIGAAYANGVEAETGSIEPGKSADLVVLSSNLFEVPPREIAGTRVLLTLVEGKPVYRDPSLSW
jgi:predicted amidohydrolase YtcJ